ncbi:unnamed protein product, partial [Meganyctiphanes norvegica]
MCDTEGLQMAMPANDVVAVALRIDIFHTYGEGSRAWLGACGGDPDTGREGRMEVVTQRGAQTNATISSEDPLWAPGDPGYVTSTDCLYLRVWGPAIKSSPGRPYVKYPCSWAGAAPLCEVPLLFNYNDLIVNPGEQVPLECGMIGNYSHCLWEKDTNTILVEDVYNGTHSGLMRPNNTEGNQCGIVVEQALIETHGIWTCKIYNTQYGEFVGS